MSRRTVLRRERFALLALLLSAALLAAAAAHPAAAPAHEAPMVNLPPVQLPTHGDPFMPEENIMEVATPQQREELAELPYCDDPPHEYTMCIERCWGGPDILVPCGVALGDPTAVISQAMQEIVNPPRCEPDPHIHVIYAYPRNRPDSTAARIPQINSVLNRANARLFRDGRQSSSGWVPAEYRVGCDAAGQLIVHTVFMPNIDALDIGDPNTLYQRVVQAVQAAGHTSADDKYLVYAEVIHPTFCGQGDIEDDPRKTPDNLNNDAAPDYAVVFASHDGPGGAGDCFTSSTTMHELGHVMGAVQRNAPNSTAGWHCSAMLFSDVMCYPDGTAGQFSSPERCSQTGPYMRFDCSFNTYFDTVTEESWVEPYLDTNWNVGGPENRFLWRGY